jgi:putative peptidoglycan lipid II flippase
MGLNLGFSILLTWLFAQVGLMPHGGLPLANSLATFLEMAVLITLMRKKLNGLDGQRILTLVVKAGLAALGMSAALWGWLSLSPGGSLVTTLGGVMLGGLVYIALLGILRVEELKNVLDFLRGFITSRIRR